MPDDCDELQTLRHWRDKLCKSDEKLKLLTEDYYKNAPSIIEIIDSLENSRQVYAQVYNELVVPTVELLKSGETDAAIKHYKAYYLSLTKKYGKPNGIEIVSQSATLGRY
ncbi:MAG: hypothetical protein LBQ40_06910 [Clostridiales bacterium]|nr:hypothetical protein [Clostridiales bacterium]